MIPWFCAYLQASEASLSMSCLCLPATSVLWCFLSRGGQLKTTHCSGATLVAHPESQTLRVTLGLFMTESCHGHERWMVPHGGESSKVQHGPTQKLPGEIAGWFGFQGFQGT